MSRRHRQPTSRISKIPTPLTVLVGASLGIFLTLAAAASDSKSPASGEGIMADNSLDTTDDPEAPSPWWLVVMPAIPLMGGGLIYTKRRFFGSGLERQETSSSVLPSLPAASSQEPSNENEQN